MKPDHQGAEYIGNSRLSHIYTAEWKDGKGKFLNVVFEQDDVSGVDVLLTSGSRNRIKLTISFLKERGDIKSIELRKYKEYKGRGWQPFEEDGQYEHVRISPTNFAQVLDVLDLLSRLDIDALNQRRVPLTIDQAAPLDDQTRKSIRTLLARQGGADLVESLLQSEDLIGRDIVNVAYRKDQLGLFRGMLDDRLKDEAEWQSFFQQNEWIFGFGLDYQFRGILQSQPSLSDTEIGGRGEVIGDFLLADRRFTAFVELKSPLTPLFGQALNRSRAWRLSHQLTDATSQILQQKASGQLKLERGDLFDAHGRAVAQKAYDAKVFLIIGSWDQLDGVTDEERDIKTRTLELFRRDSRNVEIILFDELFERAKYIVEGED